MAGNASFDQILSTTLKNYLPKLEDNIFTSRPLANWLQSKNRIRKVAGGESIVVPIEYVSNTTVATYSEFDTIATTPQEEFTAAEYVWKQLAGSVTISGLQKAKNSSKEQVIDLFDAKVKNLEKALGAKLNTMFHASSVTGNNWNTIATLIDSSGSGATIGGINRATDTFWQSKETAVGAPLTLGQLSTMWNDCHDGTNDTPDLLLTTDTLWEKYESLLQPQQRFSDAKTAQAGFENLLYKAGVPIQFDPECASGVVYFLNSNYIKLVAHSTNWMRQTDFKQPSNADYTTAQIISYGQLTVSNPRRMGKITGATA